jgi:hypothetical protein
MPTACLTAILVSAGATPSNIQADASCLLTDIYPLVAILSIRGRLENVLIPDIPKIPHIPRTEFSLSLSLSRSLSPFSVFFTVISLLVFFCQLLTFYITSLCLKLLISTSYLTECIFFLQGGEFTVCTFNNPAY